MSTDEPRANSARVYELILAGETPGVPFTRADQAMVESIATNHPNTIQGMQLHHLYIEVAAAAYREAGIRHHIDIGAGLPTVGALHEFVDGPILYIDQDPESVAYGQQILADRPQLHYIQARLENISAILDDADRLFGGQRLVGVNLISIVHFVDDESLSRALQQLYDWCAPGSLVAVTSTPGERQNAGYQLATSEYKARTGLSVYVRTTEEMIETFQPWQPVVPPSNIEDQIEVFLGATVAQDEHRGLLGYGGIFHKP